MKRVFFTAALILFALAQTGWCQSNKVEILDNSPKQQSQKSKKVTFINPKKAILVPGSFQSIAVKDSTLTIEYEKMHPTGKFPVVRIQDLPFKLTKRGESIKFTWSGTGYELIWLPKDDQVALLSSEPFGEKTFSPKTRKVNHKVIFKGMMVETKTRDGKTARLEVTDVIKTPAGKMQKFSTLTYSDKDLTNAFQNENNIPAPEVREQYEKGVNGEVLFIFTTNQQDQIEVYYR